MSTYSEEDIKGALELAQELTGCKIAQIYGERIYARADILADTLQLSVMRKYDGPAPYLLLTLNDAISDELFKQVKSLLCIPEHHMILEVLYRLGEPPSWYIHTLCDVEPWPVVGVEDRWLECGVWRSMEVLSRMTCHVGGR